MLLRRRSLVESESVESLANLFAKIEIRQEPSSRGKSVGIRLLGDIPVAVLELTRSRHRWLNPVARLSTAAALAHGG